VRPGIDGLHFEVGRALDLARVLQDLARAPQRLAALSASLERPITTNEAVAGHLALYRGLRGIDSAPRAA
jgi:hypothetical protein